MDKLPEEFSQIKKDKKKLSIIFAVILALLALYIYNNTFYVIVRFDELGPVTKNMSAYYRGFKIGRVTKISPDKDFKHTIVKVNLISKDLDLPQNMVVSVEKFPNGEQYLQFIYPQSPSLLAIRRGDVLEGLSPYSLEQFMMGQSISGVTDIVSEHIIKALNSADAANQEIKMFFKVAANILNEDNQGLKKAVNNTTVMTKNLAQMAENLNQTSKKLNNALDESTIRSTACNIKDSTANVKDATLDIKGTAETISKASKDIDKTMKEIDDAAGHIHATAKNLHLMSVGLHQTLSKRFGGMRLFFGTPVKSKDCFKSDIQDYCQQN